VAGTTGVGGRAFRQLFDVGGHSPLALRLTRLRNAAAYDCSMSTLSPARFRNAAKVEQMGGKAT
jgi:hypothetical protein